MEHLMKVLYFPFIDRCELADPQSTEQLQNSLLAALQYHVTTVKGMGIPYLGKLMAFITETRTPSHYHTQTKQKFVSRNRTKGYVQLPPLLEEVWQGASF